MINIKAVAGVLLLIVILTWVFVQLNLMSIETYPGEVGERTSYQVQELTP